MNILFLSRWFPFPPDNGSKIRIYHLLRALSQVHDVTLLSFSDLPLPSPDSLEQQDICSEIHVVPWKPFNKHSAKAQLGFFSLLPRSLMDTHSLQMESLIRTKLSEDKFDLVIASQLTMASYSSCFHKVPALFEEIELGLLYEEAWMNTNLISRFRARLSWMKLQYYLSHLLDGFASITVASQKEYRVLAENFQAHEHKVEILPNCIDVEDYQNITVPRKPRHIIFSGSFTYEPNYYAMLWFIGEVMPLILHQIPDAHLIITGDHGGLPVPQVNNIILAGYVDNVRQLIASCDVSIAPLWVGGGTRLKILEAMAIGIPVVATSKGAEGLLVKHREQILIADEPAKFAECVINLLQDNNLSAKLSSNGARLVKEEYDWRVIAPKFLRLIEKTVAG